jgi:hypothetical protein
VYTGFGWTDLRERDHLYDLSVAEKIILKWISKKWEMGWLELDCSGLGLGEFVDTCKFGTEPSGSIKFWQMFDQLRTY